MDKEQALIPEKSKTDSKPVDKPLGGPEDTAPKRPSKGDTAEKPSDKAAERPKTGTDDAASKQPGKDDASEKASSSERPSMKDRPATRPAITPNDKGRLPPAKGSGGKMNATFVTLARNSDVWDLAKSIRNIEDRFNRKYNYDWVFLNDKEFDDNFKTITSRLVSGTTRYGIIPEEHWSFPEWIDQDKAAEVRKDMAEKKIIYGDSISYRHMCRYESGFFFRHPLMNEYEWYWRVEPSIELYCDIDYDTFEYMSKHNKMYSFVISLYEYKETIPTIWDSVKKFMRRHPEHIPEKNLMEWVSEDGGETYNRCHFVSILSLSILIHFLSSKILSKETQWSNFEIGNLNWLRSPKYLDFFDQLDKDGGFFYERWGDAPVHSLAAALTLEKDQIHFFNDIAYWHVPFTHCPTEEKVRLDNRCHCNPSDNFDWNGYSCRCSHSFHLWCFSIFSYRDLHVKEMIADEGNRHREVLRRDGEAETSWV